MLKPAAPGPAVVACNTCRLSDEVRENEEGKRGGALLVEALRRVQASDASADQVSGTVTVSESGFSGAATTGGGAGCGRC